jgi:hypothetical protein
MTEKPKLTEVKSELETQCLFESKSQAVTKMKVDGGFIYHTRWFYGEASSEAMCFVPEKNKEVFEALETLKKLLEILISQAQELKNDQ